MNKKFEFVGSYVNDDFDDVRYRFLNFETGLFLEINEYNLKEGLFQYYKFNNCDDCPFSKVENIYDLGETTGLRKIHCKYFNKRVYKCLNFDEDAKIPSHCPFN